MGPTDTSKKEWEDYRYEEYKDYAKDKLREYEYNFSEYGAELSHAFSDKVIDYLRRKFLGVYETERLNDNSAIISYQKEEGGYKIYVKVTAKEQEARQNYLDLARYILKRLKEEWNSPRSILNRLQGKNMRRPRRSDIATNTAEQIAEYKFMENKKAWDRANALAQAGAISMNEYRDEIAKRYDIPKFDVGQFSK